MTETFTWKHKPGAEGAITLRVREVKFGDGYSQAVKDGINNVVQKWPLAFEGNLSEMQPIYDFLVRQAGATSFYWTPPGGQQSRWRAAEFRMLSIGGGVYSVTAEFNQSFTP